ncbi:hypothetical protein ACWEKM_30065 [Streptomyces sp. NPDC004752]
MSTGGSVGRRPPSRLVAIGGPASLSAIGSPLGALAPASVARALRFEGGERDA